MGHSIKKWCSSSTFSLHALQNLSLAGIVGLKIIVLSEDLILWYYVSSLFICLWMYWITQHCDYDVHVLSYALSNKWFELKKDSKSDDDELSEVRATEFP
jgi:hypothetical protein